MKEEMRAKMLEALKHMRHAATQAKEEAGPDGKVQVGILSLPTKGPGRIVAHFDAPEFFEELSVLLDAPPLTEDDIMVCKAFEIVSMFGGRVVSEPVRDNP